jgi:uncharacterized protein YgiB involved in biofilm formation
MDRPPFLLSSVGDAVMAGRACLRQRRTAWRDRPPRGSSQPKTLRTPATRGRARCVASSPWSTAAARLVPVGGGERGRRDRGFGALAAPDKTPPRLFFDAAACREAKALSDADYATAYANAKAEFDERAPRFSSRAECERFFRRCMIGDIEGGGRRVAFTPQMQGFAIENGRERQVVPVAEGGGAEGLFQPRAVGRAEASAPAARRAEAQEAWKRMIASPAPSFGPGEAGAAADAVIGPARATVSGPQREIRLRGDNIAVEASHKENRHAAGTRRPPCG